MAPKEYELHVVTREIMFLHNSGLNYRKISKRINLNFFSVRYEVKCEKKDWFDSK